jgi:hypothetical protein
MAYGILTINDQVLAATEYTTNSSQLDTIWFTDFNQYATPSTSVPAEGGMYFCNSANGGSINSNVTPILNPFGGHTAANGAIQLSTGTTSNSTGYGSIYTHQNILPGIPTPTSGLVTKYEFECLLRMTSLIHSNSVRGVYRLGFMNSISNAASSDGVYFEFLCNGTTTDTTWKVVFMNTTAERNDTTVTVAANTTYRMYLSVEVDSSGIYTTTYKIKNITTGTNTEGTTSPTTNARYPSGATDYFGVTVLNSKTVTATTTSVPVILDYLGVRIRRPLFREILIGNI